MPDVKVTLRRKVVHPNEPPKPVHRSMYAIVGSDISLDLGHVDIREMHDIIEQAKATIKPGADMLEAEIPFYVTDRFVLTIPAAVDLLQQMQAAVEHLKQVGILQTETKVN